MDPQSNAEEQVRLARTLLVAHDADDVLDADDAARLAELVLALAEWRARGGFAPDWARALVQR